MIIMTCPEMCPLSNVTTMLDKGIIQVSGSHATYTLRQAMGLDGGIPSLSADERDALRSSLLRRFGK